MIHKPYRLDMLRRKVVLKSLQEVCSCRGWALLAAHVRTNHIHVVIRACCKPEQLMTAIKAYSSRALNEHEQDRGCRWGRHGSTRYLWSADAVQTAIGYVVREQGEPMAVFQSEPPL